MRAASVLLFLIVMTVALIPASPAARLPPAATAPAAGMLLVARRDLPSPRFAGSVILLLRHGDAGTLGVILNRRSRVHLHELLPEFAGVDAPRYPIHIGGPVAPQAILTLTRAVPGPHGGDAVTGDLRFSNERAVLEALVAARTPPARLRLYVGHAGWARGQLAHELARGEWHLLPADPALAFDDDGAALWERLIDRLDPPGIRVRGPRVPPARLVASAV